jgi:hypothetical protein
MMADDITYSGSGATVPSNTKQVTDEHATRGHMPIVKLAYSADGVATLAQLDADGLLVNLGANNDVTITGTVSVQSNSANLATQATAALIQAAVETIDDAISGGEMQVDIVSGGPIGATTDAEATADGTAIAILKRLRTLLGGTLTIGGTVTANAGTNLNTSALALESGGNLAAAATSLAALDNAVSGNELQVDVLTMPTVTVTGTVAINAEKAEDAAHSTGATGAFVLAVRNDAGAATFTNADGDYSPIATDSAGRVGISDLGGAISIDDNGGSVTVDGAVAATQSGTWNVNNVSGTVSLPTGASTLAEQQTQTTALQLIDNLVLAEDAAHNSGDVGVQVLAVRKDSGAAIAGTDGDYSPLQVDSSGNLRVNIAAGAAAGGTSATDEAAYTPTSSAGTPIMGAADETSPDAAAEGTLAIIRSTLNRALHVNLRDASGNELAVGGGTQYTEDAAATANPTGNALILVREDARAGSLTSADGDNVAARGTNAGELYVKHVDAIPVTQSGTWDEVGINDSGNSITVDNPALSVTGGGVEASALRVTIASDSTGVLSIDDNGGAVTVDNGGTFAVQVDGAALTALQLLDNIVVTEDSASAGGDSGVVAMARRTGTPANQSGTDGDWEPLQVSAGRLWASATIDAALPAGTNNIGDVDILSIAAGDNNIGNVDIVTLPNVTLAAGTNTNEVVGDVAQDAAVAGNPLLVGGRASTATPTAMSADGDSVYQWLTREGATVTAGNLVDDAAFTPATSRVHPAGYFADETATDSIDEGDIGAARMSLDRKQYVIAHSETSTIYQNGTARTPAFAIIDAATSGDNTLLAAQGAGNKIRVHQLFLVSTGTVTVRFESGAGGTALSGQMNLVANTGFVLPYSPIGWFETAANTLLNLELSAAVSVDGNFAYTVVT